MRRISVWQVGSLLLVSALAFGCQKHSGAERTDSAPGQSQNRSRPAVDFETVEIAVTPVAGNVYMLEGAGGNIGVSAGPDGVLMVDGQFAPLAPKIREAIAGIAKDNPAIAFLINTHYHLDHTNGNPEFGGAARIVAHTNVRKRLSTDQTIFGNLVKALPAVGWPTITFDQEVSIHFNGEEVKVKHLPGGHTDGDSVVFFTGANVVHTGDQFFNGRFPVVDLDHGGNVETYAANVAKLIESLPADVKIIPGHGPLGTPADLRTFHQILTETIDIVRKQMDAGRTLEQIQKDGLPAKYDSWGAGFINEKAWIAIVHASLSR